MDKTKIDKLVSTCLEEVVEHLLQDSVNSVHIKNIRSGLLDIRESLESIPELPQVPVGTTQNVKSTRTSTRALEGTFNKDAALEIAFAMSKFDYVLFNSLYALSLNQGEVFEMTAAILGIKPTTLRNYRDTFDSHVHPVRGKKRQGWKKPLPDDFIKIKERLDGLIEEEVMQVIAETLYKINPDIELIIKIGYGFLFSSRAAKSISDITVDGMDFELINAPYPKGIAYFVMAGFGNTLTKGIYPAIYAYRDFGKVFTVYGESITHVPDKTWGVPTDKYERMESYFVEDEIELIKEYPHTYLSNYVYRDYVLDQNAISYGEYKIELAKQVFGDLRELIGSYTELFEGY